MSEYSEKINGFIDRIKKDKKSLLIISVALLGMMLILFSGEDSKEFKDSQLSEVVYSSEEYEEKLSKLVSEIDGVGRVSVMITFESGEENVFASDDEEFIREEEKKTKKDYIIIDTEKGETGLKIKSVYPEIKGVAVVCVGASDPVVREQIVSVITALFDISSKNISVVSARN